MGRVGGHAIIEWICQNLPGNVFFKNNCSRGWEKKRFNPKIGKTKNYSNEGNGDHLVLSIEDFYLPLWEKHKMGDWKIKFDHIIAVIRSPKNWLASSIAAGGWLTDYLGTTPDNEVVLPVNRIDAYLYYFNGNFPNTYNFAINYDKWCNDISYRESLSKTIFKKLIVKKPKHCKFSSFGKNHNYTGDRSLLLNEAQKKRFDNLYIGKLKIYQEKYFE
ncbi:MAG TPA: hypothetical protein VMV77_09190 [Bacteroidales bacterium]|nr:hypothetical protein [Bacteroidales bacterium]